jgi:putative IMPACT (imprinted ancient) family translation regulator
MLSFGVVQVMIVQSDEWPHGITAFQHMQVIKKSRFIARATPCSSFDKAQEFLRTVSDPKVGHSLDLITHPCLSKVMRK